MKRQLKAKEERKKEEERKETERELQRIKEAREYYKRGIIIKYVLIPLSKISKSPRTKSSLPMSST